MSGSHWPGYITTDVGLPLLAITAVVFSNRSLKTMVGRAGDGFATFFIVLIYLLIGPLFAIPRTGSVSFELAILPFLGDGANTTLCSFAFTAVFFGATYLLSANPNKIVAIVGKVLTPILLLSIFIIGISAVINPISPLGETGSAITPPSLSLRESLRVTWLWMRWLPAFLP